MNKQKKSRMKKKTGRKKSFVSPVSQNLEMENRWISTLLSFLGVAAGVALIVILLFNLPFFEVRSIQVANNHDYDQEKIISLSGLKTGQNIFLAPVMAARQSLLEEGNIRDVVIQRVYPDILHIRIFEREPRARLRYGRGDVLTETIDEQAVILSEPKKRPWDRLPSVYGLEVEGGLPSPPEERVELTCLLKALDQSGLEKDLQVKEIHLKDNKMVLITADELEITMKKGEYQGQLDRLKIVLNRVKNAGQGQPSSIDLRPSRVPVKFHK